MRGDARSRRVAVVADHVLNPPCYGCDPLTQLAERGWGVVALPQPGMPRESEQAVLAAIADQLATFLDDGYEVALAGPQDERTARLLELLAAGGRRISGRVPLADPGGGSPDHDPGVNPTDAAVPGT